MQKLPYLRKQDLIERVLLKFAEFYGCTELLAGSILVDGAQNAFAKNVQNKTDFRTQKVNSWWKDNKHNFRKLGLDSLVRVCRPANIKDIDVYDQLVCLVFLAYEIEVSLPVWVEEGKEAKIELAQNERPKNFLRRFLFK